VNEIKSPLTILLSAHTICNFNCPYCFNQFGRKRKHKRLLEEHRVSDLIQALCALDRNLRIIISGLGEPLISKEIETFVEELYPRKFVESIMVFTNLSLLKKVEKFVRMADKVKFHASLHTTEMPLEEILAAVKQLKDWKVLANCSMVAYKYNWPELQLRRIGGALLRNGKVFNRSDFFSGQTVQKIITFMKNHAIPFTIQAIDSLFPAYTSAEKQMILSTRVKEESSFLFREKRSWPDGVHCGCGYRYVLCDQVGNLHRCSRYSGIMKKENADLGNIYNGAVLLERAEPCLLKKCSNARQEYALRDDSGLTVDKWGRVQFDEDSTVQ
jgi:hypothetical protein